MSKPEFIISHPTPLLKSFKFWKAFVGISMKLAFQHDILTKISNIQTIA